MLCYDLACTVNEKVVSLNVTVLITIITFKEGSYKMCRALWTRWCEEFLMRLVMKMSGQQELLNYALYLRGSARQTDFVAVWP